MICSVCKKQVPCAHNDGRSRILKFKDGRLVESEWDGLFDSKDIHLGGVYGNPVPDPKCNCHACDKARLEQKR